MKSMVVGVLALARALAREPDEAIQDRLAWDEKSSSAVLPRIVPKNDGEGEGEGKGKIDGEGRAEPGGGLASVLAPQTGGDEPVSGAGGMSSGGAGNADESSDATAPAGHWEIACEIKSGSALVFDRASLRDYGAVTLFRWSAPRVRVAGPGDPIFTAVVNCREKTIEAAWPGRSRETYS